MSISNPIIIRLKNLDITCFFWGAYMEFYEEESKRPWFNESERHLLQPNNSIMSHFQVIDIFGRIKIHFHRNHKLTSNFYKVFEVQIYLSKFQIMYSKYARASSTVLNYNTREVKNRYSTLSIIWEMIEFHLVCLLW